MAERSIFGFTTNGVGDGLASGFDATAWQTLWRALFHTGSLLSGVFNAPNVPLASLTVVSTPTDQIVISPGYASVAGHIYASDANVTHTIARPAATTGGHVVLECNWTAQTVRQAAYRNTSGNTATPALTQTDGTLWQIRLCTFQITAAGAVTTTDIRPILTLPFRLTNYNIEDFTINESRLASKTVVPHTAGYVVLSTDNKQVHTNEGAGTTLTMFLPAALTGMEFFFAVQAAQQLRIDPSGTETIALPSTGVPGAAGKYLVSSTVGNMVHIICTKTGTWSIAGYSGTWTLEP